MGSPPVLINSSLVYGDTSDEPQLKLQRLLLLKKTKIVSYMNYGVPNTKKGSQIATDNQP